MALTELGGIEFHGVERSLSCEICRNESWVPVVWHSVPGLWVWAEANACPACGYPRAQGVFRIAALARVREQLETERGRLLDPKERQNGYRLALDFALSVVAAESDQT